MDKYNLQRFEEAQEQTYEQALREIRKGHKLGHWIWYIFPQMRGLGYSSLSDYYGIANIDEATAYLGHPILGERLREITEALLVHSNKHIEEIFTQIDAMKVCSSMTLFDAVCPNDVFQKVIDKYYNGDKDQLTLAKLHPEKPIRTISFAFDSVEHSPEYKAIEKQVEREIQEILDEQDREFMDKHGCEPIRGMGFCHRYWAIKREVLARHGIKWRSPAEMNPHVMFD